MRIRAATRGSALALWQTRHVASLLAPAGVEIVTVTEAAIVKAARDHLERMKIVVEPSAGTVLAAVRARAHDWRGLRIGAILSGGNTDFRWLETGG